MGEVDYETNNGIEEHKRGFNNFKPPPPPQGFNFTYLDSFKDYFRQFTLSDKIVEEKLLSILPFFPTPDETRSSKILDTQISGGNYIHEFFIENHSKDKGLDEGVKDIVLIHGYAANLGLFFNNYDSLSSIPGVRVHAIDLLGFGFSSRPKFPFKHNGESIEEVIQVEDWFIDAIEEWRKARKIENFILMGHSFGGYLSACYALKYNKRQPDGKNLLNKLVLMSPVGVERNTHSLLKNIPNPFWNDEEVMKQNENNKGVQLTNEISLNQTDIKEHKINPKYLALEEVEESPSEFTFRRRLIYTLWQRNVSPFTIIRSMGPIKSKLLSVWTKRRFSEYIESNLEFYRNIHDYFYRSLTAKGSGEYAITRILAFGAVPKLPLIDRLPQALVKANLPTLWCYGDVDWMNVEAGQEAVMEINKLANKKIASIGIVPKAGHHLYLDNTELFNDMLFKFLGVKRR